MTNNIVGVSYYGYSIIYPQNPILIIEAPIVGFRA